MGAVQTLVVNSIHYIQDPSSLEQLKQVNDAVIEMNNVLLDYKNELSDLKRSSKTNAAEITLMQEQIKAINAAVQSQLLHKKALEEFKSNSNLRAFYNTLMSLIEAAFISYKAVEGGIAEMKQESGGTKVKAAGMAASGARILGSVLSFIPGADLVGKAVGAAMDDVQQAMIDQLNDTKADLVHNVNLLMGMHGASEVAINVAYNLTKVYSEQLKAIVSHEAFEEEMSKIPEKMPALKKRAMIVAKLIGKTSKEVAIADSIWDTFSKQLLTSINDEKVSVEWTKLCGIGGRFIVNMASSSSSSRDMAPFAQVAAEYAALHVLEAITTLSVGMDLEKIIKHLENSVHALKPRKTENSSSHGFFSELISKVKSTSDRKSAVSVLFRMFDSAKVEEINVHDLFALPGVNVANQLFSGASCNPNSFRYIDGTMDLVTVRKAVIQPMSLSLAVPSPVPFPILKTSKKFAGEFLTEAIGKGEFISSETKVLRKMISEENYLVLDCCTAQATYASVMMNWRDVLKGVLQDEQISPSSMSLSSSSLSPATKALDLVTEAFQQKLISQGEKVQLIFLVSQKDPFILSTAMTANNSLQGRVEMWRVYLQGNKK